MHDRPPFSRDMAPFVCDWPRFIRDVTALPSDLPPHPPNILPASVP